jgi:hypothetical protein
LGIAKRTLLEIDPVTRTSIGLERTIDDFADTKVLIVLGDPGSGKTHLLTQASSGLTLRTASRIVNNAPLTGVKRLFVDAVDEVAGNSSEAWVKLVNRLEEVGAPRVVISCRAQDWRGESLGDFKDVYGKDALKIVHLQPLTRDGALAVLEGRVPDPAEFVAEVERRDLGTFLLNPNDLNLLVDATKSHWPATRKDLFRLATETVLSEANDVHADRTVYRPEDLEAAAGWVCASLLLSGEDATELDGSALPAPLSGTITRDHVKAVMKSRAFAAIGGGKVQPAHRTVSEFLAGRWLAGAMTSAREEARIKALIVASDGAPPTSLRSLFAWTVNCMRADWADRWLEADPMSLVLHGDVELLMNTQRASLLRILAGLTASNPAFGSLERAGARWQAFITSFLAAQVGQVLLSPTAPPRLKVNLLSGVEDTGSAAPTSLVKAALDLALAADEPDDLRAAAVRAYLATGADHAPILDLLDVLNADTKLDKSYLIRAAILHQVPGLKPTIVANTVLTLLKSTVSHGGRVAYAFERLSVDERGQLLDLLLPHLNAIGPGTRRGQTPGAEANMVLSRLVGRLVKDDWTFSDDQLIALNRIEILPLLTGLNNTKLKLMQIGEAAGAAAWKLFQDRVLPGPVDKMWGRFVRTFDIGNLLSGGDALWPYVVAHVKTTSDPGLAFALCECVIAGSGGRKLPEAVLADVKVLVQTRPELAQLQEHLGERPIPQWKIDQQKKEKARAERLEAVLTDSRKLISENRATLRDWTNKGLLKWIAEVYFGHHQNSGVGNIDAPGRFSNLIAALEEPLAHDVAEDLIQGLSHASGSSAGADLALLAAMELAHAKDPALIEDAARIDDALAGRLFVAQMRGGHGVHNPYTGDDLGTLGWPARLIATRAKVAADALLPVLTQALRKPEQHVVGLWQISHAPEFASVRLDWALQMLSAVPNASPNALIDLLSVLLDNRTDPRVLAAIHAALASPKMRGDNLLRWTTAGWLIDPTAFKAPLQTLIANARIDVIWSSIHTLWIDEARSSWRPMDEAQLTDYLSWIGPRFRYVPHPNGWSGNTNPWDASDRIVELMRLLAARGTTSARDTLQALQEDPKFKSYSWALATNADAAARAVREQALSKRELKTVAGALLGGPPATLADAIATVVAELKDLELYYRTAQGDGWKKFWNLDDDSRKSKAVRIKGENDCRNTLLDELRLRLPAFAMRAEEHTVSDERIDIVVYWGDVMIPIEAKLDDNKDLWTAATTQLSERYANDYNAAGLGIYLVFWSAGGRGTSMKTPPGKAARPTSPDELRDLLESKLTGKDRERVEIVVMDLSKK